MDWDPISPIPLNNKGNPWAIRERSVSPIRNRGLHSSNPGRLSLSSSTSLNPSEIRFGVPQTPSSIFGTRTPASTDPIKNNPPPMAEMKFRRIASPTHDDTGLEGIFDGGLRIVDEPEIVTRGDGVRQEREALIEVLGRIGLLVVAGGVVGFAPTGFKVLALPAVVTAALWRMVRTNDASRVLSGVEILATIATGFVSALGVAEERVLENVGIGIVAGATVMEVWRLLLRMQRQRKRVFWKEERKRALEDEKKARRTAAREEGSTSPVYGLNSFGFRTASPAPAPLGASMSLGNSRRGRGF